MKINCNKINHGFSNGNGKNDFRLNQRGYHLELATKDFQIVKFRLVKLQMVEPQQARTAMQILHPHDGFQLRLISTLYSLSPDRHRQLLTVNLNFQQSHKDQRFIVGDLPFSHFSP